MQTLIDRIKAQSKVVSSPDDNAEPPGNTELIVGWTVAVPPAINGPDASSSTDTSPPSIERRAKIVLDVVIASVMLLVLVPVLLLIAFIVRRDGGPALFGHERIGIGGKRFNCLKFRSMVTEPDSVLQRFFADHPEAALEWRREQKLANDPRTTPIGRVLRATSLDELPQLFNVLRLEMSLVGPRPIVPSELERYGDYAADYLGVRPGLTGLWQISGRSNTSYARRVELDSRYVRTWRFWHDLRILVLTVPAVLQRHGAR